MRKHTLMIRVPGFIRVPPALGGVEPYIEREHDLEKDPEEMKSVYDDPEYAEVQVAMHKKLDDLRDYYGDSDENDQKFLKAYLDHRERRNTN